MLDQVWRSCTPVRKVLHLEAVARFKPGLRLDVLTFARHHPFCLWTAFAVGESQNRVLAATCNSRNSLQACWEGHPAVAAVAVAHGDTCGSGCSGGVVLSAGSLGACAHSKLTGAAVTRA